MLYLDSFQNWENFKFSLKNPEFYLKKVQKLV
jgi:hypothetical protein